MIRQTQYVYKMSDAGWAIYHHTEVIEVTDEEPEELHIIFTDKIINVAPYLL